MSIDGNLSYMVILFIILGVIIFVALLTLLILFLVLGKGKKHKVQPVNINHIVEAFGANNIAHVEQTQKRVRVFVENVDLVNMEVLKNVTKGVFITGNKLVVTFKEDTESIVEALRREL